MNVAQLANLLTMRDAEPDNLSSKTQFDKGAALREGRVCYQKEVDFQKMKKIDFSQYQRYQSDFLSLAHDWLSIR